MLFARIPFKWLEFLKVEYPRRCNWCKTKVRVHVQYVSSWWCKGFFKLFLKIKIYWEFYEVKFIEREKSLNVELDIYKCRVSLGKTFWLRLPPYLVISQTGHHPTINWIKNLKKVVSSDRSSYKDSGLLYNVRSASHFLRFQAFLPIYLVFLYENWIQIDNNWPWGPWWL